MITYDDFTYASPDDALWRSLLIRGVERASGKPTLWRMYEAYRAAPTDRSFFIEAVARLDLQLHIERRGAIPVDGPLIVIANHPYGVVDGLALGALIAEVRNDFRILVHKELCKVPEPRANFLPIDFAETKSAQATNVATRRAALSDLDAGRVIAIFPAGGIATSPRLFAPAVDLEWKTFVAALVQKSQATVLPIHFSGECGLLFQLASLISMDMRASLLWREAVQMIGADIKVTIGAPMPFEQLAYLSDRRELTEQLRRLTYGLRAPSGLERITTETSLRAPSKDDA